MTASPSAGGALWLLAGLVLVAGSAIASYGKAYYRHPRQNTFTYLKYLEQRLEALEEVVNDRSSTLTDAVTDLAQQECMVGTIAIQQCPGFQSGSSLADITACVTRDGPPSILNNFLVTFETPFKNPPLVHLSLAAQSLLTGKNCSIEVASSTATGFTFNYIADDFYPIKTTFNFLACPSALLGPGQSLSQSYK